MIKYKKAFRYLAAFTAINILIQLFTPTAAWALTSGPNSPEFSSFEPVATTDMVNTFSGDFTYNLPVIDIPGTEGSGYAMSLSYHSGTNIEEEASWVGYGWTLNPGAMNRNTRGFPDDYDGAKIDYYNKAKPNLTSSVTGNLGAEIFSLDISLGAASTIRYNNYQGFSKTLGFNVGYKGLGSIGLTANGDDITVSANISPGTLLRNKMSKAREKESTDPQVKADVKGKKGKEKRDALRKNRADNRTKGKAAGRKGSIAQSAVSGIGSLTVIGGNYGLFSYSEAVQATTNTPYKGYSFNVSASTQVNPAPIPIGVEAGLAGNFNFQFNEAKQEKNAFGYIYMPDNNASFEGLTSDEEKGKRITDYYVEKESSFNKRNNFIGVPFSNADNFILSGEGLSGGFRMYHKNLGHFYPNYSKSTTTIAQIGIETMFGVDIGMGVDFGVGKQTLNISNWNAPGNSGSYEFEANTYRPIPRFNGDLGGSLSYSTNDDAEAASIMMVGASVPGAKKYEAINSANLIDRVNSGSSSYIEYHTFEDIGAPLPGFTYDVAKWETRFNKNSNQTELTDHRDQSSNATTPYKKGIAEYSIYNAEGVQYLYGLPVHSRNEVSLQAGITTTAEISNNYLAKQEINENDLALSLKNNKTLIGQSQAVPYSSTYLVTQILQPGFIDINEDGPDDSDFGGWTKFEYRKAYGTTGNWYKWRTPYAGLLYSKNNISVTEDDMGMVSKGEKEVYYLKYIETKTHIACFITNKTSAADFTAFGFPAGAGGYLTGSGNRLDGRGAEDDPLVDASGDLTAKGIQETEYLERIVLFSKSRKEKPLKTVHFKYNYSLVKNLPNNANGTWPGNPGAGYETSGKLTLEKVWFEYEGIAKAKVSPYSFTYRYPTYPVAIKTAYPAITDFAEKFGEVIQNPSYTPYSLDMWGNHQYDGENRKIKTNPWVYQGIIPDINSKASFDPAAWQLKQIKLPSGGEIHIQYEQKDYSYVQDRVPMGMVSLAPANVNTIDGEFGVGKYYLNLEDIGYTLAAFGTDANLDAAILELKNYIESKYVGKEDEKLYFKFLYSLKKGVAPDLNSCKSEYISGYTKVNSVVEDLVNNTIELTLGTSGKKDVPIHACLDFIRAYKGGLLDDDNCAGNMASTDDQLSTEISDATGGYTIPVDLKPLKDMAKGTVNSLKAAFKDINPEINDVGNIDPTLSYLRIPLLKGKRGGGVRVKRLLMYDNGIESGVPLLYGSEYFYEQENGLSSGVATNEPSAGREENALVAFLPRKKQSFLSKIVTGEDKKDAEGPIGESILPAPSIGHSRVVVENIHKGKTGTGFTVHEFYTVKDYAFDRHYPEVGAGGNGVEMTSLEDNQERDFMVIPAGLFNFNKNRTWMSQGFRFIQNDMHGKQKSVSTFGGEYLSTNSYMSTSQEYTYFEPGEKVDMLSYDGTSYNISQENPGKEMDVVMEQKSVSDVALDFSLEVDVSIGVMLPPPVFVTPWLTVDYSDSEINTHATTKVIHYPSIVKSIKKYQDGSWSKTDNLAFDKATGQSIVTRSFDSFNELELTALGTFNDGAYYEVSLPGWWYYNEMGQKSQDPAFFNSLQTYVGSIKTHGANGNIMADATNDGIADWFGSLTNVVEATVQTFGKNWYDVATNPYSQPIIEEWGLAGTDAQIKLNEDWKPLAQYVYKDNRTTGDIYGSGYFNSFQLFPYRGGTPSANYIKASEVLAYDPNGNPVMENNALNIKSAARYGYKGTLPVIIAQNAEYATVYFHDFEESADYPSGFPIVSANAHSGSRSFSHDNSTSVVRNILLNSHLISKGGIIKLWLKTDRQNLTANPRVKITQAGSTSSVAPSVPLVRISQAGEWTLYEGRILNWGSTPPAKADLFIEYNKLSGETVNIDDVRFQPIDAQAGAFVYDAASRRLLARFDDQHFGLFYQYNEEGKLVRKLVETEKGVSTITETQYNMPKEPKP